MKYKYVQGHKILQIDDQELLEIYLPNDKSICYYLQGHLKTNEVDKKAFIDRCKMNAEYTYKIARTEEEKRLLEVKEYFEAIKKGEYPNSRPQLRDFEKILLERIKTLI